MVHVVCKVHQSNDNCRPFYSDELVAFRLGRFLLISVFLNRISDSHLVIHENRLQIHTLKNTVWTTEKCIMDYCNFKLSKCQIEVSFNYFYFIMFDIHRYTPDNNFR